MKHFNSIREEAFGKRLNIPSGAAVRFEPGDEKEVELIALWRRTPECMDLIIKWMGLWKEGDKK